MANTWWIVVPSLADPERNAAATPKDAIIAEVSDTSPQYNTWLNTDNGGATYNGKTYYRRMGPFTSQQAAQQAYQQGATNAPTGIPGVNIPPEGGISFSNPLSGLESIAAMLGLIGKLISALFDPAMWWSLGWLFAGLVLFLIGTWLLAGKPQLPAIIPV